MDYRKALINIETVQLEYNQWLDEWSFDSSQCDVDYAPFVNVMQSYGFTLHPEHNSKFVRYSPCYVASKQDEVLLTQLMHI